MADTSRPHGQFNGERSEHWLPVMAQIVKNREAIPQSLLQQYQRQLVHYNNGYESELGPWTSMRSLQVAEQTEIVQQVRLRNVAPVAVRMQIVVAPGEYTVPVKQDKRLMPSFKVRVEVEHRGSLYLPVAVSAYPISQEEYDNINQWLPIKEHNDRKQITELKGTTRIDHLFDLKVPPVEQQMAALSPQGGQMMTDTPGMSSVYRQVEQQPTIDQRELKQMGSSSGISGLSNLSGLNDFNLSGMEPFMSDLQGMQGMGLDLRMGSDQMKQCSPSMTGLNMPSSSALPQTISKVFEFSNLEFNKPSRMKKVYLVFGCSIYDQDFTFCVYQVPTVVYCRKEQVPKACTTLRIPFFDSTNAGNGGNGRPEVGVDQLGKHSGAGDSDEASVVKNMQNDIGNSYMGGAMHGGAADLQHSSGHAHERSSMGTGGQQAGGQLLSRAEFHQWVTTAYEERGFTRPLTPDDLSALDQQIGFMPGQLNDSIQLSQEHMQEFDEQFQTLLRLLSQLGPLWNQTDPFMLVAGLDMDRAKAVHALADEQQGTFLCRFSWSNFGTLVLTCKVAAGTPNAEEMGTYGIMNIQISHEDLRQRRLGTWIKQYHAASTLLDAYRNKRIDKRRAFQSAYTSIRNIQEGSSMVTERSSIGDLVSDTQMMDAM